MHHNPAKNVLYIRASVEEIAKRLTLPLERVRSVLQTAKEKMYAARLKRPTPYVDKTVYVGWNALCVSAYLEAGKALNLNAARRFALRSLDRLLAEGWHPESGLAHVIAYSEPGPERRNVRGLLDDYAFTAIACLDAYETTADLSYFNFARRISDRMIELFFDPVSGGFFDTEKSTRADKKVLGVLGTPRKPFQDSPTPAGNSAAAIALLRLNSYAGDQSYRDKAEQTMEVLAASAGQYGIFAATYGIAAVHFSRPHTQVIVVGSGEMADRLAAAALTPFAFGKSVLKLAGNEAVANNLPPGLAQTIPQLPEVRTGKTMAVICSDFTCQPAISDPEELAKNLRRGLAINGQSPPQNS
jgi:hypothetical protein